MAFLDNFGKKVSQAGQSAIQKTKTMADIARVSSMISDEEKRIEDAYLEIGKVYVEQHTEDCEDIFKETITHIHECEKKIAEYKQQLQDIKGVIRCPECGAEVPKGSIFCAACGFKMPVVQEDAGDDILRCEKCGAQMQKEEKFCSSCGTPAPKIENSESADTEETQCGTQDGEEK